MQATGWTFRAQNVASGTTSLVLTKPSGTVDNDIMLIWITHKGAGYGVFPAGWTLVAQDISGATRGELYWKRAAAEGANYTITGLADTATGLIASYIGGLLSGDVVDVSDTQVNASLSHVSPQVTPTVAETLLVSSVHQGANLSIGTQGTGQSFDSPNEFSNFGEWDEQLNNMRTLSDAGTNNGTDCRLGVADACKVIPDITGAIGVSVNNAGENVRIVAAFKPETSQVSAGTRFYFSDDPPPVRINELTAGDWDSAAWGPNIYGANIVTLRLAPRKTQTFHLEVGSFVTNRQGDYDELIARFVTPPLEAQSISGTIDLSLKVLASWLSTLGLTNDTHACWKIHVYITEGETGIVRHTLLDNFVDSAHEFLRFGSSQTWYGLGSPQALTLGNALDGDTVIVELGVRIISSPTPVPTEPPTEYTRIALDGLNACLAGNNTSNCVGAIDSVVGTTTNTRAGWLDFSQTLVLKAEPTPAANSFFAGAIVLPPDLPFQTVPLDVRSANSNARTVWFEWTPTLSGNANIYLNGSNYNAQIVVLTGSPGSFGGPDEYQDIVSAPQRGCTSDGFEAVGGTTYYIAVYLTFFVSGYQAGELWMTMTFRDAVPQEGDLYIPNRNIFAYRDGLPINWTALPFLPAGCAIDYSHLPMYDIEPDDGTVNITDRIFIMSFGGSALVEILELPTLSRDRFEVDFIFDAYNLDGGDAQNGAALAICPATDVVVTGQWGEGFLDVNDFGTTGSNAAFFDSPSVSSVVSAMYRCSILNGDSQGLLTPGLPIAAERFETLPVDSTTAWYPALSEDGSIVYYTSDGFYVPPRTTPGAFTLRAYNLDTDLPIGVIATIPPSSSVEAAVGPHGMALHVDGTIFVTNQSEVLRIRLSDGVILQTYLPVGDFGYDGQQLWDVHIMPDGQSIVAIDGETMTVFEWNITTGVQTDYFQTWMTQGNFTQFAIYQPNPLPDPEPECPGERGAAITDGLPYDPPDPTPCAGTGTRGSPPTGA